VCYFRVTGSNGAALTRTVQVRNSTGRVGIVPETYIQIFDSSDVTLPPPPPPPVTDVAADDWGPPDPAAVADALQQRNSTMYSATDYEVQAALSAPSITDGKLYDEQSVCRVPITTRSQFPRNNAGHSGLAVTRLTAE